MPVIKARGLTKKFIHYKFFRKQVHSAVDNFSIEVREAEIFAFLGQNGAGKTTTINMLAGVTSPTSGSIELFGHPFYKNSIEAKKRIGYLPESPYLPNYYRVRELLIFYSNIFGIPKKKQGEKVGMVLEEVGISTEEDKLIGDLSMGQKRCLGLATILINSPDLIFLDEPTVYLDPKILDKVRALLLRLKSQGSTVFISSHILSEVEKLSDRFAIIHKGRLLSEGLTQNLTNGRRLEEIFLDITKDD